MARLDMSDYVQAEGMETDDQKLIAKLFARQKKAQDCKHLDGIRMIRNFVTPNKMTQWGVPKK